ncbi:GNAT family N-acetyltransferase [Salinibacterium sp. NSLL150]|uniref:GNAT family N-acetyltransferase n=1 Tax=unclassified Salinibacterium TaxID=2632331 RepID=UPI0018CEF332|nr:MULTISPECIES: GNAT family N-acetyltransferase [unclassified Salinibacterium]MBH0097968.1 GNAT family N-acetyltransferase [Salinibacterium sp. NSLL35]MBH0100723.1 GNAT family N-acetyltransferase [Salinibacterium sp. NSLL150]MBH0103482.1 GNAT family N-acetyltransferase [Salinibacterium sp. NSLL16]MBH0106243.1 GNAT family N-acetyltransferase [Salinibacterium sp. NSLL17]MBH0130256.1 GNAT family N-acetyltransferase [Salinibacterium sp. NK8237]
MTASANREHASIEVRPYTELDAASTLAVFIAAVTQTASADYTVEQTEAWADIDARDLHSWGRAMAARNSFVATIDEEVAGFSDVSATGYIDMMFVAPRFLRRGVARRLLAHAEAVASDSGARVLTADVSITARPFFERFGFVVTAEQHPVKRGVELTNFAMLKPLP